MDNLWLLAEERPKQSVVLQIIETYCKDFGDKIIQHDEIKIRPHIESGFFKFIYEIEGLSVNTANKIYIKTANGKSSFLDFLLFKQPQAPIEGNSNNNLIMAVEETKTSDDESRNTSVYQRGIKFVYIAQYYKNIKLYMLYNEERKARKDNEEHKDREKKPPTDTNIFGTNMLMTLGVTIVGKDTSKWFKPFSSLDELISFKAAMHRAPKGNVSITIKRFSDRIEVSGRLSKPKEKENIGHDPNIGALSMISACLRKLGWTKDIVITEHGVKQQFVDKNTKNKFLYICQILGIRLDGIDIPKNVLLPDQYWEYEKSSEKMADILLHLQTVYHGMYCVYENHAGCERGYFKTEDGKFVTLPKKDKHGVKLYLPDVVLYDAETNYILLVEGKKHSNLAKGIEEITKNYDSIEQEYISPEYKQAKIMRYVSIFGGNLTRIPDEKVLFYLANNGRIIINKNAPDCIRKAFLDTGVVI